MKIKSYWQHETGEWSEDDGVFKNIKFSDIKEKDLNIVIDNSCNKTVLRFKGGPTGFESYYIEDLKEKVNNKSGKFYICAGTINSWSACWVIWDDLKRILKEIK